MAKVEKYVQINDEYRWYIIYNGSQFEVYLEKYKNHWLFGGFRDTGYALLIEIQDNYSGPGHGCTLNGWFNGHCRTLYTQIYNRASFIMKNELLKEFQSYLNSQANHQKHQSKNINILNNL